MDEYKLIKCGKMFNGIDECLYENAEILIRGKQIQEVGTGLQIPENTEIIDLSNLTVTPGLIDAHVHLDLMDWHEMHPLFNCNSWLVLAAAKNAEHTLRRGFTTIRVPGELGTSYYLPQVKKAIERGYYAGSRLVIASSTAAPASHGDVGQFYSCNPEMVSSVPNIHTGSGSAFFQNSVREQKRLGYDFIKIFATGGFATPNDSPVEKQLNDEEVAAIIKTAHNLGLTVTAHAYSADLIKDLVNAGIDGIEHGSMMDEESAALMEKNKVYLIPTFSPFEEIIHIDEEELKKKPKYFADKLRGYSERMKKGREIIVNSNLKMGYGTDFVCVHQCYECGYEYESWLNSGLSAFKALKAATSVNADILNLENIGTIAAGKTADISAWSRDLLTDPKALLHCDFVMKEGVIYETEY